MALLRRESNVYFSVYRVYDVHVPNNWLTTQATDCTGLLALHHVSITNGVIRRPVQTSDTIHMQPYVVSKWNSEFSLRSHQDAALDAMV